VTPLGLSFNEDQIGVFRAMMASRDVNARAVMATRGVPRCSCPESLFAEHRATVSRRAFGELKAFFRTHIGQDPSAWPEGVWIGTPRQPQSRARERRNWSGRMPEINASPPSCSGARRTAGFPLADLKRMSAAMPNCRLVTVPGVGHSMNLEQPGALRPGYFRRVVWAAISSDASYQISAQRPRSRLKIKLGEFGPVQQHDSGAGSWPRKPRTPLS